MGPNLATATQKAVKKMIAPLAVILVHCPRGGAHDRRGIDAAFEGPGGGHVNGHR